MFWSSWTKWPQFKIKIVDMKMTNMVQFLGEGEEEKSANVIVQVTMFYKYVIVFFFDIWILLSKVKHLFFTVTTNPGRTRWWCSYKYLSQFKIENIEMIMIFSCAILWDGIILGGQAEQ